MNTKLRQKLAGRKRKIERRLAKQMRGEHPEPMLAGRNIHYELAERTAAISCGGIGAVHLLARKIGLIDDLDRGLQLLKIHQPYHESDHVLNIAYNVVCGGSRLEHIELRRNDEVFLDALGAQRIPDPTTAGDFCRRFADEDVFELQYAIDQARLRVWRRQPEEFFAEAVLDVDGTLVPTTGECKQGMDYSYKGVWGYHPLVVSLAGTGEVLRLINRPGNRPSHEGAYAAIDDAIELCRGAGFRRIWLRGDTDFSQTEHLDRWTDEDQVGFVFGIDAMANLVELAEQLPEKAWEKLRRPAKRSPEGPPRQRPENVKARIVVEREFQNLRLTGEQVAQFDYRPGKCQRSYRVIVVRKNLSVERGEAVLFDDLRYFFYITNDWARPADQIVFFANGRCQQENLIEQLKNGVRALTAPVDNLTSNWAYMVMASLAWSLKAWLALWPPIRPGRWQERHRQQQQSVLTMDFRTFTNAFIHLPCQIVRTGRRIIYRLLSWNPWQPVLFRFLHALRC